MAIFRRNNSNFKKILRNEIGIWDSPWQTHLFLKYIKDEMKSIQGWIIQKYVVLRHFFQSHYFLGNPSHFTTVPPPQIALRFSPTCVILTLTISTEVVLSQGSQTFAEFLLLSNTFGFKTSFPNGLCPLAKTNKNRKNKQQKWIPLPLLVDSHYFTT